MDSKVYPKYKRIVFNNVFLLEIERIFDDSHLVYKRIYAKKHSYLLIFNSLY